MRAPNTDPKILQSLLWGLLKRGQEIGGKNVISEMRKGGLQLLGRP